MSNQKHSRTYEQAELVWARQKGFPWWPAVIGPSVEDSASHVWVKFLGDYTVSPLDPQDKTTVRKFHLPDKKYGIPKFYKEDQILKSDNNTALIKKDKRIIMVRKKTKRFIKKIKRLR